MCPDQNIDSTVRQLRKGFVKRFFCGKTGQDSNTNRPVGESIEEILVVLLCQ